MKRFAFLVLACLVFACNNDDDSPPVGPPEPPPPPPPPAEGEWTARAPMPVPTQETTPAVLNDRLYVVGGFRVVNDTSMGPSRLVQVYDPVTDSWSEAASLPVPMHHIGLAAVNGKLYLLGGYSAINDRVAEYVPTRIALVYDPATDAWSPLDSLPVARGAHVALAYQGKIYLFGGIDPISTGSPRTDVYDPATNTWTTGANLPTVREHVAGGVVDTLLYVVGGAIGHGNSAIVEAYSPTTDSWHSIPNMPVARHAPAVGSIGGRLYVAGGETDNETESAAHHEFDPASGAWRSVASMITPRSHIGGGVIGDVFYVAGGSRPPRTILSGTTGVNEAFRIQ